MRNAKAPTSPYFSAFFLLGLGQPQHHHRQNDGVVGAEESLENDQDEDGEGVGPGEQVSYDTDID